MDRHDIPTLLKDLPELVIRQGMPEEEAFRAMRMLGQFNGAYLGMVRFSGETPWERHEDEELLYLLDGAVDVTILHNDGSSEESSLTAGTLCTVPKGLWHRQLAKPSAALLFITGETSHSRAEDPRLDEDMG